MNAPQDPLAAELAGIVGAGHVLTDPDLRSQYETDWTGRYGGHARLVVRPSSTEQVAAVLRTCVVHGAAVVTQGGNTGLVGGSVPRNNEVLLSTTRLTRRDPVDIAAGQVTVGAGLTLAAVRDHARKAGLDLAVDFSARDSATIGGAVATNAGGSRVVRYSTMRAQVAGIEAVLANGDVVGSLAGLPKQTLGIHLPSLLSGSEGTLAIITTVRLKLVPWHRHTATVLVGLDSLATAIELLSHVRRELPLLDSVELLMPSAMSLVCEHLGRPCPVGPDAAVYLLVECAGDVDPMDALLDVLHNHAPSCPTAVATDDNTRAGLMALRDNVTVAINRLGVPLKLDVAIPLGALAETSADIEAIVHRLAPHARLINFGHLAEGNLHLNIINAADAVAMLTDHILDLVIQRGGAISAEHGIGVAKTEWMVAQRGQAEVDALHAIKRALDPRNVLNPGVLIPVATPRSAPA